ncbi:MAG: hypothetical protein GYA55_14915 [SAR324 cluster bacterium]|uniref:Co-chaperone DjlA N-terminal domain-containing protein n=1 Tax=SAR324 cluster bacterium TaxID=2024889 RepID=A0A7X9ILR5_9DELT|nr:hypothetical protein [SAR324 cluster bacterium]
MDSSESTKADLELALAVILVDLASTDEAFDPSEYEVISRGLKEVFGTTKDRVQQLVNQSRQILESLRGTNKYTNMLRDNLNNTEKKEILAIIDDLIAADGKEDPFEVYMKSRIAKALGFEVEPD